MKFLDDVSCEDLVSKVKAVVKEKRLEAYPVSSIIFSADESFDPNDSFGGTWVKCYPLDASGNAATEGGYYIRLLNSSTDSYVNKFVDADSWHKLTANNLPSHSHTVKVKEPSGSDYFRSGEVSAVKVNGSLSYTTSSYGSSSPKAMHFEPPYLACYAWMRTE